MDVYCIGNPLIDMIELVNDDFIRKMELAKGTMHLIDENRRTLLMNNISKPLISPGGSCANTAMHLADFGSKVIYSGAVGRDKLAKDFANGMIDKGLKLELMEKNLPTGTSIIFVTPDTERTQNTYLGACQLYDENDINMKQIKHSKFLYFTGYMWDTKKQKEALASAIDIAYDNKVKIVFDVADPFAVNRSKNHFLKLIKNKVDFLLANFEEARMLSNKTNIVDCVDWFQNNSEKGAIKNGKNGSFIFDQEKKIEIDPIKVKALDSTGAGDIYASGILFGLINEYDLKTTGNIASYVSSHVVKKLGPRLNYSLREELLDHFKN